MTGGDSVPTLMGATGGAERMDDEWIFRHSHRADLLSPFTSAFDKNLLHRKVLGSQYPDFKAACTLGLGGKVSVKRGLLEKCLGKGLRRGELFPASGKASGARCLQDLCLLKSLLKSLLLAQLGWGHVEGTSD